MRAGNVLDPQWQSFVAHVERAAGPDLAGTEELEQAIREAVFDERTSRADVPACVERAGQLLEQRKDAARLQLVQRPDGETSALSALLVDRLRPEVERFRRERFGAPEAPFGSPEEAVQWIKRESPGTFIPRPRRVTRRLGFYQRILEAVREAEEEEGQAYERPDVQLQALPFPGADGNTARVPIPLGSALLDLKRFVRRASDDSGFDEASLVLYILAGIRPRIARHSYGFSYDFSKPRPPEYSFTIRARRPIREDFLHAFQLLQGATREAPLPWGAGRPMRKETGAIVDAIVRIGGVPSGRVPGTFWQRVAKAPEVAKYGLDPEAVRKRYERLWKRAAPDLRAMLQADEEE